MLNRTSWIFCSVSLVIGSVACVAAFKLTALPAETVRAAKVPAPPETLPELDLPGFGKVSPMELMGYYIDNPPAPVASGGGGAAPAQHFGGC